MLLINWICLISISLLVGQVMVHFCKMAIGDVKTRRVIKVNKEVSKTPSYVFEYYYTEKIAK